MSARLISTSLGRSALAALLVRSASAGLAFATAVVLARLLGAEGYGIYVLTTATLALLAIPAVMGFDQLLVRELSRAGVTGAWSSVRGLLTRSAQLVLLVSSLLAVTAGGVVAVASRGDTRAAFWVALLALPLVSLSLLGLGALQGLGRTIAAQAPVMVLRPALLLLGVGALQLVSGDPGPLDVLAAYVIAAAASLAVGGVLLRRRLPAAVHSAASRHDTRAWLAAAMPLMLISSVYVLEAQVGTVLAGAISGPRTAAVFSVASRAAELTSFVLLAVNVPLAPRIARLHAQDDIEGLARVTVLAARAALVGTVCLTVPLLVLQGPFLSLFGAAFEDAGPAFVILVAAQVFNSASGSVGVLLIMTRHERDAARGVALASVANVLISVALIAPLGVTGAAIARAASIVVWNGVLAWYCHRRLGIVPTALARR